jgi:nucleoside-diphosphate-sugar epimerase
MRWFVTGADRFVGRAVVHAALRRGDSVIAAVSSLDASFPRDRLELFLVDWDALDERSLARAMEGCDVVAHTDLGDPWCTDRKQCERAVLVRSELVLDAARRAKVPRVILRSSDRVTASGEPRRMVDENLGHSDRWLSPWDEMLSVVEGLVCALSGETVGVALRAAFLWGDSDDESLPRFRVLSRRRALVLPSGGEQSFCSTHVDNLAEAFLCAADAPAELVAGNTYWAVDEDITTARRFLTRWLVTAGERGPRAGLLPYNVARLFSWVDERCGGMTRAELAIVASPFSVDNKRTRAELGYAPKVTIAEGMARIASRRRDDASRAAASAEK